MPKTKILTNVFICDGTGSRPFLGEIYWRNTTIIDICRDVNNRNCENSETIDGRKLTVCPGFIDSHTHSDASLFCDFSPTGRFAQGVTTEITGNCGLSAFPLTTKNIHHIKNIFSRYDKFAEIAKENFNAKEFLHGITGSSSINIYPLTGYNTLRAAAAGYDKKELTEYDISLMAEIAEQQLLEGAIGISGGFLYVPGIFSTASEITKVLSKISKYNPVFSCHLRSEGSRLLESIQEMIIICRNSNIKKLHLSHLKTAGKANWSKLDELFEMIEENDDLSITFDRYPYTESLSSLSLILPQRFKEMTDRNIQTHLNIKANMHQVIDELINYHDDYWHNVKIAGVGGETGKGLHGLTVAEAANRLKTYPAKLVVAMLKENAPQATAAFSGMSYKNMQRIIAHDKCCCGSDETARPEDYSLGYSHPRGFGSMPNFINTLTKEMDCTFEKAVSKVSSLPADIFNIEKRGKLTKGHFADMVLLDPEEFSSSANFQNPHQTAKGVKELWINGESVYKDNS